MIIEFSVQNFRSIKDIQTLSMVAAPLKSKNPQLDKDNIIRVSDKLSLIKSAAIYGANGSGKSNLILAILYMRLFINKSMNDDEMVQRFYKPYMFHQNSNSIPIFFQIQLIVNNKRYRYGFEFNETGVLSEWLFGIADKNEVYYFTRELDNIKINENQFKEGRGLENKTSPTNLFLNVSHAFNGVVSKEIKNHFDLLFVDNENKIVSKYKQSLTLKLLKQSHYKSEILKLLNTADFGIKEILVEDSNETDIFIVRSITDENGNNRDALMSMRNHESQGTRNFFKIVGLVILALENGLTIVLDEFEASLHPILAKKIVEMFHSPKLNKKGAQLIFATHDTNLLNANLLRRDQIFFTEKNKKNETELYSLYDFKGVRNDASYEKDYIKGKYGAIPFVGDFETLFEEAV